MYLLKTALAKYCQVLEGEDWVEYLGEALMGLRFTITRAHGFSPYHLLFGREPQLPSSV